MIAISINKQNMKIYDANGFFAETPISTGMRGHATPMGVFSVIQKQKLHHSNIYSGAPMPYMQRITWSGIAIHAGVLPGYPASHGCIRMPMAFAVKMYGWTRWARGSSSRPARWLRAIFRIRCSSRKKSCRSRSPPTSQRRTLARRKADKAANMADDEAATSEASLELRSTVGHDDGAKSLAEAVLSSTVLREQTRTADASVFPITKSPVAMSDASTAESGAARLEPSKLETEQATAERAEIASADDKAVDFKSSQAAFAEIKSADTTGRAPDETGAVVQARDHAAKPEDAARENVNAEATKAKADEVKAATTKVDAPEPAAKA